MEVAIKVIKLRKIKSNFESVVKEIEMLKEVTHPDIVQVYEMFKDERKLYLVMEHVTGEELFDYVVARDKLSEGEAKVIIQQLIKIVKYLNSLHICHRDLKPENIMVNPRTLKIKLLDFGLSSHFDDFSDLSSPVGTPYYVSPEVLNGKYNKECDMWSIGVVTYIMLTGSPPFQGETLMDIYKAILAYELVFDEDEWRGISDKAKEFVSKLMEPQIDARLTPNEALEHPWISFESGSKKSDKNSENFQYENQTNKNSGLSKVIKILKILESDGKVKVCRRCEKLMEGSSYTYITNLNPGCTT